jgi:TetR/AcrR family transcriptional regulator
MARLVSDNFEAQKGLILRCAVEAFATEGFALSSMNRIAERAGVSKSLIYHYYPNKETLLYDAMLRYLTGLQTAVARDAAAGELRTTLRRLLGHYRAARFDHVVLMNELRNLAPTQRDKVVRLQKEVVDILRAAVAVAVPRLRDAELKAVTMLVLGMVNWIYTWYSDKGPVSHAHLAELVERMVDGAMQSLATQVPAAEESAA